MNNRAIRRHAAKRRESEQTGQPLAADAAAVAGTPSDGEADTIGHDIGAGIVARGGVARAAPPRCVAMAGPPPAKLARLVPGWLST